MLTYDLREHYKSLSCKILNILCENDAVIPYTQKKVTQLSQLNPNSKTITLKGACHAPFITHQQQIQEEIYEFTREPQDS